MNKVLIVVVALLVIGGGVWLLVGNKKDKPASTTSTHTTSTNSSANQESTNSSASATNSVSISDFAFSPASITVKKGTTVTWTNKDSTAHTVTSTDSQGGPNSDELNPGKTYSFTFDSTGTFMYHCSIHPDMTGTVTVTE